MRIFSFLLAFIVLSNPLSASTWYVRPDGGTRFSSNVPSGGCDGTADVSYVSTGATTNAQWHVSTVYAAGATIIDNQGFYETTTAGLTSGSGAAGPSWGSSTTSDGTGIWTRGAASPANQHCAFGDVRYLWQDGSYTDGSTFPGWGWIGAGGDTYIIRGSIGTGVSYRVGWNSTDTYCDATGCWGKTSDHGGSGAPPLLSGVASQHTRLLGENFASCRSASAKTQLHGGWGVGGVLSLGGSSYVDIACLDLTDFSACGSSGQTVTCDDTQDFAQTGLDMGNTTHDINITDLKVHGFSKEGLFGSTGGNAVFSYLEIYGNPNAGWNADLSDGTTGVGSLLVQNFNISWNGCAEQYPIIDPIPYSDCTSQSYGGAGDGFGTASVDSPSPGWQVHFDQGIVSYNTQDGLDALHIAGPGSTMTDTRVLAYGNMGQQLKVGGATAIMINNQIVGNCHAMVLYYTSIAGLPSSYNATNLSGDDCRAGDTAALLNLTPGDPSFFQYNTLYTDGYVGLEVEFATADLGSTNTLQYNNNICVSFFNTTHGENSNCLYSNGGAGGSGGTSALTGLTNPGGSWTNNSYFNNSQPCPYTGESAYLCTTPGLVDMTYHNTGFGNMAPASNSSAVVAAGVHILGTAVDFNGSPRPNPPTIGALQFIPTNLTINKAKIGGGVILH